ncbi:MULTISPECIES: hypothetical protein [unclassified Sphingobacterium]|uniref:hypothetical protein n=1 Tax=unclassified Sphingobacterium TaxID=2609468 RepID=UPI001439490C|nr:MULTISPECIES: hypothetical protein [unclassified Sphingobacterium]NJI72310.1 hypothetical protein [Sphingobacterium sp. B16(2022)]QQD12366.1 hypothetical protein JAZ75_17375 [Sphingobacterium sp. UDSM-2020]
MAWFELTGTDPYQASNYTLRQTQPFCTGTDQVCAIQALNDGSNNPVISPTLEQEIELALANNTPSTNVKLKDV